MKTLLLVSFAIVAGSGAAFAGENPSAKLAMHVVASSGYLDCEDLLPAACDSINVDVSVAEILAASGYGCVAFIAYDVEGITGVEFAVTGWPSGRGAPQLSGPYWCSSGALAMGNHLADGGITSFLCEEASASGIALIGYVSFGPLDEGDLPIDLDYSSSSFSYPSDPHNYVLDCTIDFQEDSVVAVTGCTIGGTQEVQPDCPVEFAGGGPEDGSESVVVESGLLYVYGNRLDPPYVFSVDRTALRVNGVRLYPALRRARPPVGDTHPIYYERHTLKRAGFDLAYSMLEASLPHEVIADSMAELYRRSSIVDSVSVNAPSHITVRWVDDPFAEDISVPSGPRLAVPEPNVLAARECRAILRDLERFLESGAIALYGDGYRACVSEKHRSSFEDQLGHLQETGDTSIEACSLIPSPIAEDLLAPLPLISGP